MLLACACALSRRAVLTAAPAALALGSGPARAAMNIEYVKSPGGVEYAELKAGTGAAPRVGQRATIDYMMTRRGGAKIYSSVDSKQPFSYVIGDGTVIEGLEQAVLGSEGMLPLLPGGVRRVIVPQARGYGVKLASWETAVREVGPIPPEFVWTDPQGDKVNSYARFKNIYLNPNRIDQPDLLLDVCRSRGFPEPSLFYFEGESWDFQAAVAGVARALPSMKKKTAVIGYNITTTP